MDIIDSRNFHDGDQELEQARIATLAWDRCYRRSNLGVSAILYGYLDNPSTLEKMPRDSLNELHKFTSNGKHEAEIRHRKELLQAYSTHYAGIELSGRRVLDTGTEARVYHVQDQGTEDLVVKRYNKKVNGWSPAAAVDAKMACSFLTHGDPDFEVIRGASYAKRRIVADYIAGTLMMCVIDPKTREKIFPAYGNLAAKAYNLHVGGDVTQENTIYQPDTDRLVMIDLHYNH
ncbi:hypothetical protein FWF74_02385 [Candidatus Saccharibacteria bacterium]|nr:hypothetical protein [Candidatus Saccharibacteria bacterium]MCL1962960.1 hypothetical protein [Candidatus Saccharibacteria bacterium]